MRIAQQLYEGVDIKGRGTIGLITYLRTDSTRISEEAVAAADKYITDNFGEIYIGDSNGRAKTDKKIQDAHEAIRPTDVTQGISSDCISSYIIVSLQARWRGRYILSRV